MVAHRLHGYPFPIAYPARLFAIASDPADRLDKAGHFVELTTTTLGVLALGWCQANALTPGGVQQWERRLDPGGVTLGIWTDAVRAASKAMAAHPHDPVARTIRLAASAALPGLEEYSKTIRNVFAHGGKPRWRPDQQAAVDELDKGVSAILDGIEPLTQLKVGLVRDCSRRERSYLTEVEVMLGFAEPFPSKRIRSPVPHEAGSVVAYHHNSLEFAVDLSPYCVWSPCPDCGRNELFYLHQRRNKKQRSYYFSFSSGHKLELKGDVIEQARKHAAAFGMEPLGSVRAKASYGWRATWTDLAPRPSRFAARMVDLTCVAILAAVGWIFAIQLGLSTWISAAIALILAILYEPVTALTGGTPGKRLLRIDIISAWDSRALGRSDTVRRALLADLQLLFPPLAIRNLAWLLWDPARQCLHDRKAASIVTAGRPLPGQKV
jgi:hypothetical protein